MTLPIETMCSSPFVISQHTTGGADKTSLVQFIQQHRTSLTDKLYKNGAVLLRGFDLHSAKDFEDVAYAFNEKLQNDYRGTSPRDQQSKFTFNASEFPSHYPVMQHCEMSFLSNPPELLFFFCKEEPEWGGETPICDFRLLYEEMDPVIKSEFEKKGVRMIRNYGNPDKKQKSKFQLKTWEAIFQTRDKQIIEQKCSENSTQIKWLDDNKLRLIDDSPAFKKHPVTESISWFNHTLSFHPDSAVIEYEKIAKRQKDRRSKRILLLLKALIFLKKRTKKQTDRSLNAQFGDGSEIPTAYIRHIQDLVWKNMYFHQWKKGDILILDNFSTSHGRMPYKGKRHILVAWS